jgi:peptidoglycan/xylan/chitin deacetylase (PgdA/CDA1 family)
VVALSFDDGPSPANTPVLLELLARHGALATFFVVGEEVERHPELARELVAAGHELGNHSFSHPNPLALPDQELAGEFARGAEAIELATGRRPEVLRPPYGKRAGDLAALCGSRAVLWSIDSGDTAGFTADRVAREVTANVRSGDVVLMHDGGGDRPTTIAATGRILENLGARGYRFVTVSQLFDDH